MLNSASLVATIADIRPKVVTLSGAYTAVHQARCAQTMI